MESLGLVLIKFFIGNVNIKYLLFLLRKIFNYDIVEILIWYVMLIFIEYISGCIK